MAAIDLNNVSKRFGVHAALHDVTLHIDDREFFVVVGPSGCGKSTLLRLLAGLEQATEGQIMIGGRPVGHLPPGQRNIAMVFQNYALFPHLTVFENIAFGLRIRRVPRDKLKDLVLRTARVLELDPLLEKRPAQLSGGQRQRVALGRAMVREPDVFLYDEPLSNLDARLRGDMRAELLRLHARAQTTAVYVTHDQVEAMTLGERICVIRDGTVQQVAPAMEIYNRPANLFVATFLGAPPMNIVPGRLVPENAAMHVRLHGGKSVPLKVPPSRDAVLRRLTDQDISLGVRPEVLRQVAPDDGSAMLRGRVEVAELTGGECLVHFRCDESMRLVARVPGARKPDLGAAVAFTFNSEDVHLFDKQGRRADI